MPSPNRDLTFARYHAGMRTEKALILRALPMAVLIAFSTAGPFAPSALAAGQCVVLSKQGTRETLTNRCNACREVHVRRERPGGGFPTDRVYRLMEGSSVNLPFRGTGRTRITIDAGCETDDSPVSGTEDQLCISIVPKSKIGPALVNRCQTCRVAVIESRERDGMRRSRTYMLDARSYVPFTNVNALDARILSQSECK